MLRRKLHESDAVIHRGRRLAKLVGERRALLILDGLEPLQYAPTSPTPGELKDQGIAALLKGLAATSQGLCVVTTRYSIPDLRGYQGKTVEEKKLARLSMQAGVALLQSFDIKGSLRKSTPSADGRTLLNEFEKLVEDVKGHALTLNLLGSYLRDAHAGDLRKRDLVHLSEANAEEQGGHAFHVMDAYVESLANGGKTIEDNAKGQRALAILRLLGLFDRPATADCLAALWTGNVIAGLTEPLIGLTEAQRNTALTRLRDAKLLTVNRAPGTGVLIAVDAHPLLREYFAQRLRATQPEAWRAAHRRLYEHLCATTKEGDQPTLEDLQPLYQAVAHGGQAGLQQEVCMNVYVRRILRGTSSDAFYSTKKLGAFGTDLGAIACLFEQPWSRISPALSATVQDWLLSVAAFNLRALGRLSEAVEPMRAAMESTMRRRDWTNAAMGAGNLSELVLTMGDVVGAVRDAEQSVAHADRSDDGYQRMGRRTTLANALHQAGRRNDATAHFHEAETLQAKDQPPYPLLYSTEGFQYCDLLLAAAERTAWTGSAALTQAQRVSDMAAPCRVERQSGADSALQSCRVVSRRAQQTLEWVERGTAPLLDIALDHLTLGRAALYASILDPRNSRLTTAIFRVTAAVSGLRLAGQQDDLPRGLLTRAWLRSLTGSLIGPDSAQSDLDEAWEIAERGPMPLHMVDIHLYRARLFFREPEYPWDKNIDGTIRGPGDDLAEAEKLIKRCGYHRRDEELADAKNAMDQWGSARK